MTVQFIVKTCTGISAVAVYWHRTAIHGRWHERDHYQSGRWAEWERWCHGLHFPPRERGGKRDHRLPCP